MSTDLTSGQWSPTTSVVRRNTTSVGAAALIGIGVCLLLQQTFGFGAQLIVLGLGLGLYAAYTTQQPRSDLIVPAGVLSGLGLGSLCGLPGLLLSGLARLFHLRRRSRSGSARLT